MLKHEKSLDASSCPRPITRTHRRRHGHAPGQTCLLPETLTQSVYEARLLREAGQTIQVCTQMGNQGSAEDGCAAVESSSRLIGPVRRSMCWTNRPIWPQEWIGLRGGPVPPR